MIKELKKQANIAKRWKHFRIKKRPEPSEYPGKERPGLFEWAIYQNEKLTAEKRQENENWKLVDETEITPIEHFEPSFDFLKSVGQSVTKPKEDLAEKRPAAIRN